MSLKQKATQGLFWAFSQQFTGRIIGFIVTTILARILMPEDFGTIAVFGVFIAICSTLIDSGLTSSLIRTKDIDDSDLSTVFFFNIAVSLVVYVLLFLFSPSIAQFFDMPQLTNIIRMYSVTLVIGSFVAVQNTLFSRKLDFKTQLKMQVPTAIVSGAVGIAMAYYGWGVWALVYMNIVGAILSAVQPWYYSKWRPKRIFSKKKFNYHFNFGVKLSLSGLLDVIFQNIYTVTIGKFYNAGILGFYNKANSLCMLPVETISGPINRVSYPLFSEIKDDNIALKNAYRKIMRVIIFLTAPTIVAMGVLGEPLFRFLFTEKWLPAVPYFQVTCILAILYPIHAYNLNILLVKGRSDLFLKLEILKKILIVISVAATFKIGVMALLWGRVATSVIALFINCYYSGIFLKYSVWKQLADLLPSILLSVVAGGIIYWTDTGLFSQSMDVIRLITGSIIMVILYLFASYILKFEQPKYIQEILANLSKKSKQKYE